MNILKHTLVVCSIMALGGMLGGCSMLNSGSKPSRAKAEKDAEMVLPRDREQLAAEEEVRTYTSEDIKRGVVKGDWAIEEINGKPAVGEKAPYLRFSPSNKMAYGYNGCNFLNGPYSYNPEEKSLSFGDMASTMRMCQGDNLTDYEINLALSKVVSYDWEAKDNDYYLYLYNAEGTRIMTLMHQNFDFLNGTWLVRDINDTPVNDPEMKIVMDVDEGKIHGNTGCNLFNGAFEIDMEAANSISFSNIALTRMACPEPNHETALVVALEEVSAAKPIAKDEVVLFDAAGKQVLRLTRTTDQ